MKKVLLLAPMASVHEKFNIANINVLRRMGCEIHVAANFQMDEHTKEYEHALQQNQIVTHHIPFERGSLKRNLSCIPEMKELFCKEQYDMVHCHTETGGILTRLSMSACKKTKYIYTPHGMSFYKGSSLKSQLIYRPIERWICSGMQANLAINKEEYEVLCGWDEKTAFFVHGIGVGLDKIQNTQIDKDSKKKELGIAPDAVVLLSVGELNENKNHSVILKALDQMERLPKEFCYLICGEGMLRDKLIADAKKYELSHILKLPGYRYDMDEIFHIADAFVFPSYHEGLPVSVMQAMSVGLPIVCSKIRGNTDLIVEKEGGFLCGPDDAEGFGQYLSKLLDDSTLSKQMGDFNRNEVEKYAIANVERELENIYQRILG